MRPRIQFQENMGGGATEPEGSLGCDGLDVGDAANAIRSKNLSVVAHPANSTSRCDIRKSETTEKLTGNSFCRQILVAVAIAVKDGYRPRLEHGDDLLNEIGVPGHDLFCAFLCGASLLAHIPALRIHLV
jgi:hypothetical protein